MCLIKNDLLIKKQSNALLYVNVGLPIMQDIWICCIGSIGGNLMLCDLHKQTIVSKLHVMEGPILSLAITNNCVVVVGVTHKINDDEQELIFALHGEISFARHVQLLAQRHHWRIDITILDGKRLRSILHLKNAIWEPAVVSFPITKTMPQNVLPKKKRCVGFATKSSTTLPNFLLESCMNNNLFFYKVFTNQRIISIFLIYFMSCEESL
jgi:hypothetical protein